MLFKLIMVEVTNHRFLYSTLIKFYLLFLGLRTHHTIKMMVACACILEADLYNYFHHPLLSIITVYLKYLQPLNRNLSWNGSMVIGAGTLDPISICFQLAKLYTLWQQLSCFSTQKNTVKGIT